MQRAFVLFAVCLAFPAALPAGAEETRPMLVLDAGGHTARVNKVLFTRDGKELITVSNDKTIRFWDVKTGEPLRVLRPPIGPGQEGILYSAALSPDGKTLAVGAAVHGGSIYLIALSTGQIERILTGHTNVIFALAFAPDGRHLVSGGWDNGARLWDVATGNCEHILEGHSDCIFGAAYSPDSRRVATASLDGTGRIWSVASGKSEVVLRGHGKAVNRIAWSPDGKTLATGGSDQSIRLWNADGTVRRSFDGLSTMILSLAFTADSSRLLYNIWGGPALRHGAAIRDLASGKEAVRFHGHSDWVLDGALSPDGSLVATTGGNDSETFLWKANDGTAILGHPLESKGRAVWSTAWAPDGRGIAWGNRNTRGGLRNPLERSFQLGELELGPVPDGTFRRAQLEIGSVGLQSTGPSSVAVRRGQETVSELKTGNSGETFWCFTLLGDDRAAVGTGYGWLYLFDTRSGKALRAFRGHTGYIWAVAPSPDNRYLLSGSKDQTLRVWDPEREEPLLSLFFAGTDWIAWTPEGYYAASPGGERLMGWQVNNGPDQLGTFYPAAQFRKTLYRPDVIKRLLEAGSLDKALAQADEARGRASTLTEVGAVLPPKVQITSPAPGQRLTEAEVKVQAVAHGAGAHPVTSLQLLLDGRPYEGRDSLKVLRPPQEQASASWSVRLPPGSHRLAVKAASAVSDALSEEREVSFTAAGRPSDPPPAGTLYVLAVGINAYPGRMALTCAAPDARLIARTFQDKSAGLFRRVQTRVLTDQQATRSAILQGLRWLRDSARPGDVAVAFYAGHGDCRIAGRFFLVPCDADLRDLTATGVSGEELKAQLADLPCSTVLILDACYAGSIDARRKKRALPGAADNLVRDFAYDAGLVVLCGAAKEQEAAEEEGHGYFTRALAEGLSGKAGRDGQGRVTLLKLQDFVVDRVRQLSGGEQEPTLSLPSTVRSFPLSRP